MINAKPQKIEIKVSYDNGCDFVFTDDDISKYVRGKLLSCARVLELEQRISHYETRLEVLKYELMALRAPVGGEHGSN